MLWKKYWPSVLVVIAAGVWLSLPTEALSKAAGGEYPVFVYLLVLGSVGYMVPGLIAVLRKHHNRAAIVVLNFLLGWTFLGWVAALVWACTRIPVPSPGR